MREAYITINTIPTHVMTWGKWVEETFKPEENELILLIPGNPGLLGFYTHFLRTLHEQLQSSIPIWAIGHAGHDSPPATGIRKIPDLHEHPDKYNLQGQIQHKIAFIRKYVPAHVKIHVICHSIGSYMFLELLKHNEIKDKIEKGYLLFPTIERMGLSPNAPKIKMLFNMMFIILAFLRFLARLPAFVTTLVCYAYFTIARYPKQYLGTAAKFVSPRTFEQCFYLANDEFRSVVNLDVQHVAENKKLIKLYYGASDGWTPLKYYTELKEKIPTIDAEVDAYNLPHAFMLNQKSDSRMAMILSEWIRGRSGSSTVE